MRILFLLLFCQSIVACQQVQDMDRPLVAGIDFNASAMGISNAGKTQPALTNVIFQSMDGGETWNDITAGLPKGFDPYCVYADGDRIYIGTESGLYRSTNPPATQAWEKEVFLERRITEIYPCRAGLTVCSYDEGVFQKIPGTEVWKPIFNTLEDKKVQTLLETRDGAIFIGTDNGMYKSADGGETWKHVYAGGMIVALSAADGVMVGAGEHGLLRSTDAGEHWTAVLNEKCIMQKTEYLDGRFFAITRPWKAYGDSTPVDLTFRLRTSADKGLTWQRIEDGLSTARCQNEMDTNLPAMNINDIKQAGKYLFCSLDTGVFRSADGGKTWELVRRSNGKTSMKLAVFGQMVVVMAVAGC